MRDATATLLEQVLSLPERDRTEIAARLLESLDPETQDNIGAAWVAEIERRCAAVDAGTLGTSDWKARTTKPKRRLDTTFVATSRCDAL
jgi:putative addiction module component (TIGR02574 family)